jgi:hypothetical protein
LKSLLETIMPQGQQLPSSSVAPHAGGAPTVMPDVQFTALRLWALDFASIRAIGVAIWPASLYTPAQKERLRSIAYAIPQGTRLVWVLIVAIIWFLVGFLLGFLPLIPLISTTMPATLAIVPKVLVMGGIFANILSGFVFGSVIASWIGGWLLQAVMPMAPLDQADGDAELLARIRRQIVRVVIFSALSAAEPALVASFVL